MGTVAGLARKAKSALVGDPNQLSYFEEHERRGYSRATCKRCLEHMIDLVDFGQSNSLKKISKYLNPALKYLAYCKEQGGSGDLDESSGENYLRIHEEELVSSAGSILNMYCDFLRKVVPANISYFHFMRERDLYTHYCTLKYVLEAGHVGSLHPDVFRKMKTDSRLLYIRLLSHWLYDMVKYKCSAIYLQSQTLPHLITINAAILCGLMGTHKLNFLEECSLRFKDKAQRVQTYQHCLYSLAYMLTEAHTDKSHTSGQGNGCLQMILLGIVHLLNCMWKDMPAAERERVKPLIMFSPSYWYAQSIGFIKNPTLENMVFRTILDLIRKRNNPDSQEQDSPELKETKGARGSKKQSSTYEMFTDEMAEKGEEKGKEKGGEEDHMHMFNSEVIEGEDMLKQEEYQMCGYEPINTVTHLMLYHCLKTLIGYFEEVVDLELLQLVLKSEMADLPPNSLLRPFLVAIIDQLIAISERGQEEGQGKRHVNVMIEVRQFGSKNKVNYSTQKHVIPCHVVGLNCEMFLDSLAGRTLLSFNRQLELGEGQLWGHILTYNVDKFDPIH